MTWKKTVICLAGVSLVTGLLVLIYAFGEHGPPSQRTTSPLNVSPSQNNMVEQDVYNEFRELQAKVHESNQTIWAKELSAQEHEQVFIDMWDLLRSSTEKFSVVGDVSFQQLSFREAGTTVQHEHAIHETRYDGVKKTLPHTEWLELLDQFRSDGLIIEQSEWRHTQFETGNDQGARSVIAMSVHARNENLGERLVLTGELEVLWKKQRDGVRYPEIETVNANNLRLISSEDRPVFQNALKSVLPPAPSLDQLQPFIIIYDLDKDGLSEIVLSTRNIVLRNLGNMQFEAQPLIEDRNQVTLTGAIADFTGDGLPDLLGSDVNGLLLWRGTEGGGFLESPERAWSVSSEPLFNPYGASSGDIDGDGDLDLWIGQYKVPYIEGQMPTPYYDANDGFLSYILLNDGTGQFHDTTLDAGLQAKRNRRIFSGSFIDLDNDLDLDLVTISDFAGIDLFQNDGKGHFSDITGESVDERHLFGMASSFGDYNLDGSLDILAVGMTSSVSQRLDYMGLGPAANPDYQKMRAQMTYGNRLFFGGEGRFRHLRMSDDIRDAGWAWGSAAFDFDNDGDQDVYIVNGHITRSSAKEYEIDFWTHDIYLANSELDPVADLYFRSRVQQIHLAGYSSGGNFRNNFFLNQGGTAFLEIGYLMNLAFPRDYRHAIAEDLDGDGRQDLVLTIVEEWPRRKQELHILKNVQTTAGNWIGFRLDETDPRHSPIGATVTIESGGRKQFRQIVAGDSYRTQNSFTAHFGLSNSNTPVNGKVVWPDGTEKAIQDLEINSCYLLPP